MQHRRRWIQPVRILRLSMARRSRAAATDLRMCLSAVFALEYKGKHADLDKAYQQLLNYREDLQNPPLLGRYVKFCVN